MSVVMVMPMHVNTPTPIGCLIGFLALFPAGISAFLFWVARRAFAADPPLEELGEQLLRTGLIALVPAVIGISFCVYRIWTIGRRDHSRVWRSLSN